MIEVNQIIQGDALKVLKTFPSDSVDCVITSPPYFGLRSYLPKDHPDKKKEIGNETGIEEHLKVLMAVIGEIKRVLKPTGNFWLNYGDCFSSQGKMGGDFSEAGKISKEISGRARNNDVQEKSLMMLPERIALRMLDDGWILRNKIVWAKQILDYKFRQTKGSVMPTSVKDRFNMTWEFLFHFVKNKRYYFDLDAVRLPVQTLEDRPDGFERSRTLEYDSKYLQDYSPQQKQSGQRFNYRVRDSQKKSGNPQFKANEGEIKKYKITKENTPAFHHKEGRLNEYTNAAGKNLPNVWLIGIEPSKELHFARFPTALCEIPIKATCPKGGIVFDPFMGSGTTAQIARYLGRNYLGIELNPQYIELAKKKVVQQIIKI